MHEGEHFGHDVAHEGGHTQHAVGEERHISEHDFPELEKREVKKKIDKLLRVNKLFLNLKGFSVDNEGEKSPTEGLPFKKNKKELEIE